MPIKTLNIKRTILKLIFLLLLLVTCPISAQSDTIRATLTFNKNSSIVHVIQDFNISDNTQGKHPLYLYAWVNAYKKRSTLSKVKLSERNDMLFFAKKKNWGNLFNLKIQNKGRETTPNYSSNSEVIEVGVFPNKKNRFNFSASYDLQIPADGFTGYGYNREQGNYFLKYFLLQPGVYNNGVFEWQNFKDFESLTSNNTFYKITINNNTNAKIFTDLEPINDSIFKGENRSFFELALLNPEQITQIKVDNTNIIFQQKIDSADVPVLKKVLQKQIDFLKDYFPYLDEPLFISTKLLNNNKVKGIDDVKIPVINKRYQIYGDSTRLDLKYLPTIFSAYCERNIHVNKREEHWILNGIETYLVFKYLEKYHPNTPILGKIPTDIGLFNIYPLTWYEASRLKFLDRYPIYYRYFMKQNIDQPINTPYDELSYNNQTQISAVKTALALDYLESYLPKDELKEILKDLIYLRKENLITTDYFQFYLKQHASKDTDWFFDYLIKQSGGFDMKLSNIKEKKDSLQIRIKNSDLFKAPTEIEIFKDSTLIYNTWTNSTDKNIIVEVPKMDYDKVKIKHGNYFADNNPYNDIYSKNKWLKTKLKLTPIGEIQMPDFYQLFLWPDIQWNNYDKLQLGLKITNETLFPQDFVVKTSSLYSFGAKKYIGGTNFIYRWKPKNDLFREIDFRAGTNIGHYNRGLEYFKYSSGISFSLKKPVRSLISHFIELGFDDIRKQLPENPKPIEVELQRYQLLNTRFTFRNLSTINESLGYINYQYSNKFSKLYGEFYYKWKFAASKRLGVRVFGGVFFRHDLDETNYYDFGLDRITDYSFLHGLLGRSEKFGFLSQQFVMAEGGFKSKFNVKANKFMLTLNLEYPLAKLLDIYTDFGAYKNESIPSKFVYDSGLRLNIVPEFIELYFPIQSTLGFEPSLPKYHERIRFLLNLDLNRIRGYWKARKLQL